MVPLKYNLRNLRVRWVTTLLTVATTAVVVALIVVISGMASGIEHALRISGDPLDVIVFRKGANDETSSTITEAQAALIATQPEIATDSDGKPLASSEFVTILTKPRRANGGTTNLIVRGIEGNGRALRPQFKIVEGRDLKPGVNEAITSRQMANRFENLAIGEKLEINLVNFTVVGYFEAGGSSAESEVWTDARDLTTAKRIPGAVSVVNFRAKDPDEQRKLMDRLEGDEQFKLKPMTEVKYFADQMQSSSQVKYVVYFISSFLTFAAMFAAANTMFSIVASRGREIATLRALGFTRTAIMGSFMFESIMLCLIGGVIGCLLTLPFDGLSSGTANFTTFSELTFSFRFGWQVMLRGVLLAILMGAVGGLYPALRACRIRIIDGLRQAV